MAGSIRRKRTTFVGLFAVAQATIILCVAPGAASAAPVLLERFGNFSNPSGIAVSEPSGNVFVADGGSSDSVEIFGPEGESAPGIAPGSKLEGFNFSDEPSGLAIDNAAASSSKGALYIADVRNEAVEKYSFNALTEEYEFADSLKPTPGFGEVLGVATDAKGNVFVANYSPAVVIEFDSTGAEVARINTSASAGSPSSIALDSRGDLFVQGYENGKPVFEYPANNSGEIESGVIPVEVASGASGVAVDRNTDTLYVAMGGQIAAYDAGTLASEGEFGAGELESTERIAVDDETGRIYVVDAGKKDIAVFGPAPVSSPPTVLSESASRGINEAELTGGIDTGFSQTTYRFEYGTTESYGNDTDSQSLAAGTKPVTVKAHLFGLIPGQAYHYRLVVESSLGREAGPDQTFETEAQKTIGGCPNEQLRTGSSMGLADCRAYELVSPPNTDGNLLKAPSQTDPETSFGSAFITNASAAFGFEDALSGESNGEVDVYRSLRGPSGWTTELFSPNGLEATGADEGGSSSGGWATWGAFRLGSLVTEQGARATYIRSPEGSYELAGQGSIGFDPNPSVKFISGDGSHVVITSNIKLEPDAPESVGSGGGFNVTGGFAIEPAGAVYDKTSSGLHVASLLPGDVTPAAGTSTYFRGVSQDGNAIFFNVDGTLYERLDDKTTLTLSTEPNAEDTVFEGSTPDGSKAFYGPSVARTAQALFEFDAASGTSREIVGGELEVINVSSDGSHVYFQSPLDLTGGEENGAGQAAKAGQSNIYVWNGGALRFIATAQITPNKYDYNWPYAVVKGATSAVPARTDDIGSVFIFTSNDSPTGYDNAGHSEVYRYDESSGDLLCLSCDFSAGVAVSNAKLQSLGEEESSDNLFSQSSNLSTNGTMVFFETADPLVTSDVDGVEDVYEWEAQGTGGCIRATGCISLISSGHSRTSNWLYGVTPDGSNVYFTSNDTLLPQKQGGANALYDARVDGGFPSPAPSAVCVGEACQGAPASQPSIFASPASATISGSGNLVSGISKPATKAKKARALTRAQKLAVALKACRVKHKTKQRSTCEKKARRTYGRSK